MVFGSSMDSDAWSITKPLKVLLLYDWEGGHLDGNLWNVDKIFLYVFKIYIMKFPFPVTTPIYMYKSRSNANGSGTHN